MNCSRAVAAVTFVFLALGLLGTAPAEAAPGDLDSAFGGDGKVIADLGGNESGQGVVVQRDGKVVAVGRQVASGTHRWDFALTRHNADGSPDTSFSGDGKVTSDLGDALASDVALQADGKIVVVGYGQGGTTDLDFKLARYNPDGSLDESFSGDGKQSTDFTGYADAAFDVAVQGDGRIVVVGSAGDDFGVARYNADGSLDESFSGDGKAATHLGSSDGESDSAGAVAIQADGKIVAVGTTDPWPTCDPEMGPCDAEPPSAFAVARYNADGSLDASFSGDGKEISDVSGGDDSASEVALQADGKIVAAGSSIPGGNSAFGDVALARYNPDGSLDPTFGTNGKQTTDFDAKDAGHAVEIQEDGKIVVVGKSSPDFTRGDFAVFRFNADGSTDTAFSNDGRATTEFGGSDEEANGLALQPDGKIVGVGTTAGDGASDFAIARYAGDSDGSNPPPPADTTAPDTTITSKPETLTNAASASFGFSSTEADPTFECSLDNAAFSSCSSPKSYSGLSDGRHTFEVRATDAAGNTDATPALHIWTIDSLAPQVTTVSPPAGETRVDPAVAVLATFSEAMDGNTIDKSTFKLVRKGTTTPVSAGVTYDSDAKRASLKPTSSLKRGATYTATVTTGVKDEAGNSMAGAKTWSFTVR